MPPTLKPTFTFEKTNPPTSPKPTPITPYPSLHPTPYPTEWFQRAVDDDTDDAAANGKGNDGQRGRGGKPGVAR